jgi:hypothetical protein
MADQILTYPHGIKYSRSGWDSQVKQGTGGSIPCNNEIYEGTQVVNTGGEEWWGSGVGNTTYSWSNSDAHPFNQTLGGSSQKGLHYWLQTKTNGYQQARWFDIGAEGGKNHGVYMANNARSSWLREVTAVWFLFNAHDTTQTRDCYVRVEKVAIRYRDPRGYINIKKVTEKLGDLSYMQGVRGSSKEMFGYALSSSQRSEVCNNEYHFLGLRVQIQLRRGASGTSTDTLQGGISGIRLGLGTNPTGSYNTTNKRALVLRGDTTWTTFAQENKTRDMLETR